MRKLIVSEFMTLDGVMEAPGGEPTHPHTNWVMDFQGEAQIEYKFQEVLDVEALLLGRETYESFAGAWPHYEGSFADRMNAMRKHVVTKTLKHLDWNNSSIMTGDIVAEIRKLKEENGDPLLTTGSLKLVHLLMANKLVDEYRVMIFPVLLGSGRRLFPDTPDKTLLRHVRAHAFETGVVEHTYVPA